MKYTNGKDTRSRILSMASSLFLEESYDAITYDDIAKATYLNRNSIYYHFSSKEAIRAAIMEDSFQLNMQLAHDLTGTRQHIAMTSASLFWYDFLYNDRTRRFYADLSAGDCTAPHLAFAGESYFQFLASAFRPDGTAEDSAFPIEADTATRQAVYSLDAAFIRFLAEHTEQYDHFGATRLEFDLVARLLRVPEERFEHIWSAARALMERIPYGQLGGTQS